MSTENADTAEQTQAPQTTEGQPTTAVDVSAASSTPEVDNQQPTEPANGQINTEPAVASDDDANLTPDQDMPKGYRKSIDRLTRQKYEQHAENQQLRAQIAQIQQQQQQQSAQSTMEAHNAEMPKAEDFGFDTQQHQSAMKDWMQRGKQIEQYDAQVAQNNQNQADEQTRIQQTFVKKTAEASIKYPDFNSVINDPSLPSIQQINPAAAQILLASDSFGDVAYYLAKNPAELYEFQNLTPMETMRRVIGLEQKFAKPAPAAAPVTPIVPATNLSGQSPASQKTLYDDNLSMDEFMAMRNKAN